MVLKEDDKTIILRYLNEGVAIKNKINPGSYYSESSEIIRLFKKLGYKIEFKEGKYTRIIKE